MATGSDCKDAVRFLGKGGYGRVYYCRDQETGVEYALKQIPSADLTGKQQDRIEMEKRVLENNESSFICRAVPITATSPNFHNITMEYIDGEPLYRCIWNFNEKRRLPESIAKWIAAQLVLALADLQSRRLIHCDLKSGNVLVTKDGWIKVIDFGFARDFPDTSTTYENTLTGGTHYIRPPELFTSDLMVSPMVDWWALGVIILEMVLGRPSWGYKPSDSGSLNSFYAKIQETGDHMALDRTAWLQEGTDNELSDDLVSIVKELLQVSPETRLGCNGSSEVMTHPWFRDIDWNEMANQQDCGETTVTAKDELGACVQKLKNEGLTTMMVSGDSSESSAESIDSDDNIKFFGDF